MRWMHASEAGTQNTMKLLRPWFPMLVCVAGCVQPTGERQFDSIELERCSSSKASEIRNEAISSLSVEELKHLAEDPRKLASAPFPLPEGEFDAELKWLAKVLEAKLSFLEDLNHPNGSLDDFQCASMLKLAADWQLESCRGWNVWGGNDPSFAEILGDPRGSSFHAQA